MAALVPFARAGLEQDAALVAAVTASNIALLRDALGADAAAVTFIDRDEWYRRPATTVAGWQRLLTDALARGHKGMRIVGEVAFGASPGHSTWTRYEAALNDVFAAAPAWIVCPYDTRVLPDSLLAEARRTHPATFHPQRRPSAGYLAPEQFLRIVAEPMPPVSGPPAISMDVADGVAAARRAVAALLASAGWGGHERGDDLILAMCEIVTNSIRHGRGRRELRVWAGAGSVTCEVTDDGNGLDDPLLGYRPPAQDLTGGRGLWIAQQLCDALTIARRDTTTVVRFAVSLPERSAA